MKTPNHILVIRLSALGDVAMTVPVLRVFAQTYPEIKLTILSKAPFKHLFDDIPNLDFLETEVYGKHKGLKLLTLAKEAKKLGIDAVADLHNVIRSRMIVNYFRIHGIKTATIDKGRSQKKALIKANKKKFIQLKTTHQRYADVFSKLGLSIDLQSHIFPNRKKLSEKSLELIGVAPKKLIGIAPFAAFKSKMYPLKLMEEVIAKLDARQQYQIFLFGGGEEEGTILNTIAKEHATVTSLVGTLPFNEELSLISNLDLMLSMDSGNAHLAAMYGIPVITLWGVTHPYAGFAPFGQPLENCLLADREKFPSIPTSVYGNKYPKGYEDAIGTINPTSVVDKILISI